MTKKIFVDFDGTITREDTCAAMTRAFARGSWESINRLWEEKKLSTRECANAIFELFDADLDDIKGLMDKIEIDEHFKEFLCLCGSRGYSVYILSDGYDFNISSILGRYDIKLPYYANRLLYDNGFTIECPDYNDACGRCGTCKSGLISRLKKEGDEVIYIGDGYSDTCPAAIADTVFAKGALYDYCRENGIAAIYFEGFKDIIESRLL